MKINKLIPRVGFIIAILALVLVSVPGCSNQANQEPESNLPGEGVSVTPAYGVIIEEYFQFKILEKGLAELGYTINDPAMLDITTAIVAVGSGDADFYGNFWQPLQNAFYEQAGGDEKLELVGNITGGALQGYHIDKKTADAYNITYITQLKDPEIAQLFDSDGDGKADLVGCPPGWGCQKDIEHHMDAYGLRDTVTHKQGAYFAMMADVLTRFNNGEPILYYTWTPLWVSQILRPGHEVQWLEVHYTDLPEGEESAETHLPDGRNVGFAINKMRVLANQEFIEANPAAKKFFELVEIPIADINAENYLIYQGEDSMEEIDQHADDWITENQETFDSWIAVALEAGSSE